MEYRSPSKRFSFSPARLHSSSGNPSAPSTPRISRSNNNSFQSPGLLFQNGRPYAAGSKIPFPTSATGTPSQHAREPTLGMPPLAVQQYAVSSSSPVTGVQVTVDHDASQRTPQMAAPTAGWADARSSVTPVRLWAGPNSTPPRSVSPAPLRRPGKAATKQAESPFVQSQLRSRHPSPARSERSLYSHSSGAVAGPGPPRSASPVTSRGRASPQHAMAPLRASLSGPVPASPRPPAGAASGSRGSVATPSSSSRPTRQGYAQEFSDDGSVTSSLGQSAFEDVPRTGSQDQVAGNENISVCVRFRPLSLREIQRGDEVGWYADDDKLVRMEANPSIAYAYDRVFGPAATMRAVYDLAAHPVVAASMDGINGTVFAYGVTSSGKTHTMHGDQKAPGIIPLAVKEVFSIIQETPGREFLLRVSYLEIYNEVINDLLNPAAQNLRIREDPQGCTFVEGVKEEVVLSASHALSLIAAGEEHRHVGSTHFNATSSRSHTIFTLTIESSGRDAEGYEEVTFSQLNLIDLAGSENSKATSSAGIRRKEGAFINKSLLTLGTVISKLSEKKTSHIPYRDSKLTRLLQPSLSGNARISLVCTVTPASSTVEETHNTLKFAHRAKHVEVHAGQNKIMDDKSLIKKYQKEILDLKQELNLMRQGISHAPSPTHVPAPSPPHLPAPSPAPLLSPSPAPLPASSPAPPLAAPEAEPPLPRAMSSNNTVAPGLPQGDPASADDLALLREKLEADQMLLQSRLEEEEAAKAALLTRIQRLTKLILVSSKASAAAAASLGPVRGGSVEAAAREQQPGPAIQFQFRRRLSFGEEDLAYLRQRRMEHLGDWDDARGLDDARSTTSAWAPDALRRRGGGESFSGRSTPMPRSPERAAPGSPPSGPLPALSLKEVRTDENSLTPRKEDRFPAILKWLSPKWDAKKGRSSAQVVPSSSPSLSTFLDRSDNLSTSSRASNGPATPWHARSLFRSSAKGATLDSPAAEPKADGPDASARGGTEGHAQGAAAPAEPLPGGGAQGRPRPSEGLSERALAPNAGFSGPACLPPRPQKPTGAALPPRAQRAVESVRLASSAGELFCISSASILQSGASVAEQIELVREQVQLLAAEVGLDSSALKQKLQEQQRQQRLHLVPVPAPPGTPRALPGVLEDDIQRLRQGLEEKQAQLQLLETRLALLLQQQQQQQQQPPQQQQHRQQEGPLGPRPWSARPLRRSNSMVFPLLAADGERPLASTRPPLGVELFGGVPAPAPEPEPSPGPVLEERGGQPGQEPAEQAHQDLTKTVAKLKAMLSEKTFDMEIISADNRILQDTVKAKAKQNEELQEEVRLLRVQLTQVLQEKGPAASAKSRNPVLATLVQAQNIGAPAHATTGTVLEVEGLRSSLRAAEGERDMLRHQQQELTCSLAEARALAVVQSTPSSASEKHLLDSPYVKATHAGHPEVASLLRQLEAAREREEGMRAELKRLEQAEAELMLLKVHASPPVKATARRTQEPASPPVKATARRTQESASGSVAAFPGLPEAQPERGLEHEAVTLREQLARKEREAHEQHAALQEARARESALRSELDSMRELLGERTRGNVGVGAAAASASTASDAQPGVQHGPASTHPRASAPGQRLDSAGLPPGSTEASAAAATGVEERGAGAGEAVGSEAVPEASRAQAACPPVACTAEASDRKAIPGAGESEQEVENEGQGEAWEGEEGQDEEWEDHEGRGQVWEGEEGQEVQEGQEGQEGLEGQGEEWVEQGEAWEGQEGEGGQWEGEEEYWEEEGEYWEDGAEGEYWEEGGEEAYAAEAYTGDPEGYPAEEDAQGAHAEEEYVEEEYAEHDEGMAGAADEEYAAYDDGVPGAADEEYEDPGEGTSQEDIRDSANVSGAGPKELQGEGHSLAHSGDEDGGATRSELGSESYGLVALDSTSDEESPDFFCKYCFDAQISTRFLPCRHACYCHDCAKSASTCATCLVPVTSFLSLDQ